MYLYICKWRNAKIFILLQFLKNVYPSFPPSFLYTLLVSATDHLLNHVTNWKQEIVQKLSSKKNVVFVGVHNRRADWAQHYQAVDNSDVLVDEVHFNTAFEIYRYLLDMFCCMIFTFFFIFTGKSTMMKKTKLYFLQSAMIMNGLRECFN